MRNKVIAGIILVASILLVGKSISPYKMYSFVKNGNELASQEKFGEGREEYEKALNVKERLGVRRNILKSFYNEKKYDEVIKLPVDENFLKGNSYVYLGNTTPEKSMEFYKQALEEYKLAMKKSDDINIKKNYELTLKKLEDLQNQQQNQQNQDNQNQQDKNENKDNQQNSSQNQQDKNQQSENQENKSDNSQTQSQEQQNNQEQNDKQNSENQEQNQSENEQNQNSQSQNSQNQENEMKNENSQSSQNEENENQQDEKSNSNEFSNENSSQEQQPQELSPEEIRQEEVRAILKRLEGNEKQSFKNNERVMDINNNNPSNRW